VVELKLFCDFGLAIIKDRSLGVESPVAASVTNERGPAGL